MRFIKLAGYALGGIGAGVLFAIMFNMTQGEEIPHIIVTIIIVLSFLQMVKALFGSWYRQEYYEPTEHAIGLVTMAISYSVFV